MFNSAANKADLEKELRARYQKQLSSGEPVFEYVNKIEQAFQDLYPDLDQESLEIFENYKRYLSLEFLWGKFESAFDITGDENVLLSLKQTLINWCAEKKIHKFCFFTQKLSYALNNKKEKIASFLFDYLSTQSFSPDDLCLGIVEVIVNRRLSIEDRISIIEKLRDSSTILRKSLSDNWSAITDYFFRHHGTGLNDCLPFFTHFDLNINAKFSILWRAPITLLEFAFDSNYLNKRHLIEYLFNHPDLDLTQNNQVESLLPLIDSHHKAEFLHAQSVRHQGNAKKQFSPSLNSIILHDNVYMAKIHLRLGRVSFYDLNIKVNSTCPRLTAFAISYQKASDIWNKHVSLSDIEKIKELLESYGISYRMGLGWDSDSRKDEVRNIYRKINSGELNNPIDIVKALRSNNLSPAGTLTGIVSFLEVKFLSQNVENKAKKDQGVSQQNGYKIGLANADPQKNKKSTHGASNFYSSEPSKLNLDGFIRNGMQFKN